jgi:hypothetical protein
MATQEFSISADGGPGLWYMGTDATLYRLDRTDGFPLALPKREMAIAAALSELAFRPDTEATL